MLQESGRVVALEADRAWVQTIRKSACSSCKLSNGCGQGVMARLSDGKANQVLVENTLHLKVGDEVLLGIPEDLLVSASMVVYLLPLAVMILAAVMAEKWLGASEGWVVLAGISGLATGFLMVKAYSRLYSGDPKFCPKMIRSMGQTAADPIRLSGVRDA